jgi:glycosyltransferase involved in cell wall biosynthesis
MRPKKLSIVTTTFNCVDNIDAYLASFAGLDPEQFDWLIVDAASTDGTAELLRQQSSRFAFILSEPDAGFYHGLNKALSHISTPYYMVFGADDRPSPTLLDDVLPLLDGTASLVLGGVRLMPGGTIKHAGPRWLHHVVWGRAVSHHSVGTIIKTDVHARHGRYDTNYALLADGHLLKKLLRSDEPILRVPFVFGDFMTGGMSGKGELRSIVETFLLQIGEGSHPLLQLALLNARVLKSLRSAPPRG